MHGCELFVLDTAQAAGQAAAMLAADTIRATLAIQPEIRLVFATGASQFIFLETLTKAAGIAWPRVTLFHLDEYIDLPPEHRAAFRQYLSERVLRQVPVGRAVLIDGNANPEAECARLGRAITEAPVDLLFCGIGENGHLAFNDPPADFETTMPYLTVGLDDACRRQQLGEGWFAALEEVPERAITMSIHQIMAAERIICVAPDSRKAQAVQDCFTGEISPRHPASILRQHPHCTVFLDCASAAGLPKV